MCKKHTVQEIGIIKNYCMRIFFILTLVGLCMSSCTKDVSIPEGDVFVVEDVKVSETTITFHFKGVSESKTFSIISCQDDSESFPSYKKGDVVLVKNCRVSHLQEVRKGGVIMLCIVFLIAGAFVGMIIVCAIESQ